jgi:phospholipid/cholesterol/gamma-HCH transport system substrate-binding protein
VTGPLGLRRRWALLALGALSLAGTSCGLSLQALPKPGGVSGPSYTLKAVFANVLGLPIQARVLIGADDVGQVSSITTSHFKADLTLTIRKGIHVPQGTTAQILFVDPLGDEFIELRPPGGARGGPDLGNGATLPVGQTNSAPSIADTLAALGALLNGGGLNQLQTIVTQLNTALGGHQSQIRQILTDLSTTVTSLNANKSAVDAALSGLATLSGQLAKGDAAIATGIDTIGPAVAVLSSENADFSKVLTSANQLSVVAASVVNQSAANVLGTIRQLNSVVIQMVGVEQQLGPTLSDLSRFERLTKNIAPGNYLQLSLDGTAIVESKPLAGANQPGSTTVAPGSPTSNAIDGLLGAGLP